MVLHPKVKAAAIVGALAVVLEAILGSTVVSLPTEAVGPLNVILPLLAGYLQPSSS